MSDLRQVFLDTETTGLYPELGDRLVEIGCIEMVSRRRTNRDLHFYVNPGRPSQPDALRVHGLTEKFLSDKPSFEAISDEVLEYLDGAQLVIHNASFDIGFLMSELRRTGRPPPRIDSVVDSLAMARQLYPGKGASLDNLCKRLEVDTSRRKLHGALLDAELLSEVFIRMTRGQESLAIGEARQTRLQTDHTLDLAVFELVVIEPSEDELIAHGAMLDDMASSTRKTPLWRCK